MEYHKDRFTDHSLLVFKEEKLIAVLPANLVGKELHSHQGLTYGGLVFKDNLKLKQVLEVFQSILKYLDSQSILELNLKVLPKIYSQLPNDEINYLAFITKAELTRRDSLSVINTSASIKFSKDRIDGVKRGLKHNLEVKEVDNCAAFWNEILIPNLSAKHQTNPVHTLEEITLLKAKFSDRIRQFNVYHNNQIVAGTTIFETEHVAHSQYISGNSDKNMLGSLDFLHNYLLKEIFAEKPYFDFGISNENQGQNINEGLQYWKEGFGARTIVQDFYRFKTSDYKLLSNVML